MSKLLKILCILLVCAVLLLVGLRYYNLRDMRSMAFVPDAKKTPANPARGFYIQVKSPDLHRLQKFPPEVRLCLLAYDIYDYRDRDLTEEKLQELEYFLQAAKDSNVKCIFRAAYGFDRKETNDASSFSQLEAHVLQIAPVLNQHKDTVCCVQAGFLGPWGEWHSSAYLEDEQSGREYRNRLLDLLLKELDSSIPVNVRRPRFIREYPGDKGRLGVHNDGLLASDTDLGTYDATDYPRNRELQWMEANIRASQNGGEMPKLSPFTEPENAIREFQQMHLSYLNCKYNEQVLKAWGEQRLKGRNALTVIAAGLGYRYYVSAIQCPRKVRPGILGLGQEIKFEIGNEGCTPIGSRYSLEIIFEDGAGVWYTQPVSVDLTGGEFQAELPVDYVFQYDIRRVGLRISEREDLEKKPCNCVELVNRGGSYENGINFILEIDQRTIRPIIN